MRSFTDGNGETWTASAREQDTPRHHTRWYLVFEAPDGTALPVPDVRWQTSETAARTLGTMSLFELRRRLDIARGRAVRPIAIPSGTPHETRSTSSA